VLYHIVEIRFIVYNKKLSMMMSLMRIMGDSKSTLLGVEVVFSVYVHVCEHLVGSTKILLYSCAWDHKES